MRRFLVMPVALISFVLLLALLPAGARAQEPVTLPEPQAHVILKLEHGDPTSGVLDLGSLGYTRVAVPDGVDPREYLGELQQLPGVISAELDIPVEAAVVPNDTFYASAQASYLDALNVEDAWDNTSGTADVIIAIIDTGIDAGHPDLQGASWVNPAEVPGDGVDNDGNGCVDDVNGCRFVNSNQICGYSGPTADGFVADDHGAAGQASHSHGTLAAGIAGARGNNGIGVTGVAWGARLMSVKVLDCGPLGTPPTGSMFDVARAIVYATAMGADVINLSLASQSASDDIQALRDAITAARAAGVVIVAAAGNHSGANPGVGFPAAYAGQPAYPNVVAVAAADNRDGNKHAPFSNYGPQVTIAAPGYNIAGTVRTAMAPTLAQAYGSETGTSFATPIVSGAFALLKSRNPNLTPAEMIAIIRNSASPAPAGPSNWAGAGILNAGGALNRVPANLTGVALHNWKDVANGAVVAAVINNTTCGATTVTSINGVATFSLRIQPDGEKAGCGALGRDVALFVNGSEAKPAIPWGARNAQLIFNAEVSSVSPPPGQLVVQSLQPGWNNVAHLGPSGSLPAAFSYLPAGWTTAFSWEPDPSLPGGGQYDSYTGGVPAYANTWPVVTRFDAYWVDATAASNFAYTNPNLPDRTSRTVDLQPGWNNFLYTGESAQVDDALGEVAGLFGVVMRYDNNTGTWSSHLPEVPRSLNGFEGLLELQVYWVYMTAAGTVTFE
ncbi:MAG: S8 family serine peptidase [Tepidiformaceae bacterium]